METEKSTEVQRGLTQGIGLHDNAMVTTKLRRSARLAVQQSRAVSTNIQNANQSSAARKMRAAASKVQKANSRSSVTVGHSTSRRANFPGSSRRTSGQSVRRHKHPSQDRSTSPVCENSGDLAAEVNPAISSLFCGTCLEMFRRIDHPPFQDRSGPQHSSIASLRKSAEGDCRICSAVWAYYKARQNRLFRKKFRKAVTSYNASYINLLGIIVEGVEDKETDAVPDFSSDESIEEPSVFVPSTIVSHFHLESHKVFGGLIAGDTLSDHTGSPKSLELAARWLETCTQKHKECPKAITRKGRYFPARLVQIVGLDDCGDPLLRLYIPGEQSAIDDDDHPAYVTLSHCWGRAQFIRLLTSNVNVFRESIPFHSLPRTFRDAVRITMGLGSRNLWIDALCITQDSPEDWFQEAARMQDVYRNSLCNIAAADASDSTEGCLYPRNVRLVSPVQTPVFTKHPDSSRWLINKMQLFSHHPLYSRAWALQELLLAPRTLTCGKEQLFWHCQEMLAAETFPYGMPDSSWTAAHPVSQFQNISFTKMHEQRILSVSMIEQRLATAAERSRLAIMTAHPDNAFRYWTQLVEAYTRMNLTKSEDKLAALSGIASVFGSYLGQYLAGIWRIWLPTEMLWYSRRPSSRPKTHRAPSWSWASIDGEISYLYCDFQVDKDTTLATVVDGALTSMEGLETTQITGGQLLITGKLALASCGDKEYEDPEDSQDSEKTVATAVSEVCGFDYLMGSHELRCCSIGRRIKPIGFVKMDEREERQGSSLDIWCFPIKKSSERELYGLLLHKMEGLTFRRAGVFYDFHGCTASRFDELDFTTVKII